MLDGCWVDAGNVRDGGCRRMPLVPAMIQELVWALLPLGGARVLDLLGQYSTIQYWTCWVSTPCSSCSVTSPLCCSW